jgi:hypothetical protein
MGRPLRRGRLLAPERRPSRPKVGPARRRRAATVGQFICPFGGSDGIYRRKMPAGWPDGTVIGYPSFPATGAEGILC